jgi:adenylate cyclase
VGQDHDTAIAALTRAVELNPNDVLVLGIAGAAHFWGGSLDEALALFERAVRLGPGASPIGTLGIAHAMMCRGDYEAALRWIGRSLIENPNHEISHWVKVAAYAHLGRMDAAGQALADYKLLDQALSVARVRAHGPFKDRSRMHAIAEGLRMAGVPEN